jgi:hypothetical protein
MQWETEGEGQWSQIRRSYASFVAALRMSEKDLKVVACPHCKRETELDTYQEMFDRWIDEIRKED